ncbi:hypothetical protein P7K49_030477 [Saguinus oedipus]|uniref:Uncharacterized protein n=1 Tax=Saguinus oedipus TaxID=9490 RepID=A0ABQ9U3F5_SAGOE|nr:hypothetical protein P7K49_030477 [Saguinus oedipus]
MVSGQGFSRYASPTSSSLALGEQPLTAPNAGSFWEPGCCAGQLYKASDGVFLKLDEHNMELPCASDVRRVQSGGGALRDVANGVHPWMLLTDVMEVALAPSAKISAPSMWDLASATEGTMDLAMILPALPPGSPIMREEAVPDPDTPGVMCLTWTSRQGQARAVL